MATTGRLLVRTRPKIEISAPRSISWILTVTTPEKITGESSKSGLHGWVVRHEFFLIFLGVVAGAVIHVADLLGKDGLYDCSLYIYRGIALVITYLLLRKINRHLLRDKPGYPIIIECIVCGCIIWLLPEALHELIYFRWYFSGLSVRVGSIWALYNHFEGECLSFELSLIYGLAIWFQNQVESFPVRHLKSRTLWVFSKAIIGTIFISASYLIFLGLLTLSMWPYGLERVWAPTGDIVVNLVIGLSNSITHSVLLLKFKDAKETERSAGLSGDRLLTPLIVVLVCLGIVVSMLMGIPGLRKYVQRDMCVNNLKQISMAFDSYASDNSGRFPTIGKTRNNFIFKERQLYPRYLNRLDILGCPADPRFDSRADSLFLLRGFRQQGSSKNTNPDCINGDSYCYLGWVVTSDDEAKAFFNAYDKLSSEDYDKDIPLPGVEATPFGISGFNQTGNVLHRLDRSKGDVFIHDTNSVWMGPPPDQLVLYTIPVMWDRRPYHRRRGWITTDKYAGGNVLYLDGHVEYIAWGHFPLTDTMARLLDEHKRAPIPGCDD